MDDDAGRVEDTPQPRSPRVLERRERDRHRVSGLAAGSNRLARPLERRAGRRDRGHVPVGPEPLVPRELVHRGQVAKPHGRSLPVGRAPCYCASSFPGSAIWWAQLRS
jgi:hypothetical protein